MSQQGSKGRFPHRGQRDILQLIRKAKEGPVAITRRNQPGALLPSRTTRDLPVLKGYLEELRLAEGLRDRDLRT